MIGSIRWNFLFGLFGLVLTFLISFSNNVFTTTFLRSLYSFLILFIVTFIFRWLLGTIIGLNGMDRAVDKPEEGEHLGTALDITTPDDEESIRKMLKGEENKEDSSFEPMSPPKLISKTNLDPEELAGALRRMTGE